MNGNQRIRDIVKELRESLGDSLDNPLWIETVPGTGYMFVGTVLEQPQSPEIAARSSAATQAPFIVKSLPQQGENVTADLRVETDPQMPVISIPVARNGGLLHRLLRLMQYWPTAALLIAFLLAMLANGNAAYWLAVIGFFGATVFGVFSYTRGSDTVYARASLGILLIAAMSYIPSAATLPQVMATVINMPTIRPAFAYPFVTGLKFIPLFVLVFAFWAILGFFGDAGFAANPFLGKAYTFIAFVSLCMTYLALAGASGDYQIWMAKIPDRGHLLVGYASVLAINLIIGIGGYRAFKQQRVSTFRPLMWLCGVLYLPLVLAAIFVDQQYNHINRYYLDKRRPEAYVVGDPEGIKRLTDPAVLNDIGPDLRSLLGDPLFNKDLQQRRFYKQDFDEPFQLLHQSVMFGYKAGSNSADRPSLFVIIRFPKQLAAALRFRPAGE